MAHKEAQAILKKHEFESSHLVEGTIMADYLKESRVKVLDSRELIEFYLKGKGNRLRKEIAKIVGN
jgi:hypothetical protein